MKEAISMHSNVRTCEWRLMREVINEVLNEAINEGDN